MHELNSTLTHNSTPRHGTIELPLTGSARKGTNSHGSIDEEASHPNKSHELVVFPLTGGARTQRNEARKEATHSDTRVTNTLRLALPGRVWDPLKLFCALLMPYIVESVCVCVCVCVRVCVCVCVCVRVCVGVSVCFSVVATKIFCTWRMTYIVESVYLCACVRETETERVYP